MTPRLLLVGLDAADADLIDRWCCEGVLPNIAMLKARGTSFRMRTTAETFHVSAWPSLFTGVAPDHHGLYHAYVTRPGHQGLLRPRPDESPVPVFWKLLSDRGLRSVVMDAFLTCPVQGLHGVQIVDWGTWSWFWEPTTVPGSLGREIRQRFGPYPSEDHSKIGMTPVTDIAGFRAGLLAAVARKTDVVRWLMASEPWDLFLVIFSESHPAGHYFWHLHDPSYPTHPDDGAGALAHALRDVYVALDEAVGALVGSVDDRTTVLLVSGDGMGPNYSGSHILAPLLVRMRALATADAGPGEGAAGGAHAGRTDLLRAVRNMIPQSTRIAISQAVLSRQTQERLALRWKTAGIAWPATRAFVIENANEGYLRVNLQGREPQGRVSPGREYDDLCDELCRAARSMVNPATGRPCARSVHKIADVCRGPFRDHLPDVVITWDPDARVTTELLTDKYGLVRAPEPAWRVPPFYSGNHWPNAFAVAAGPGVPEGLALDPPSILDIAPTILEGFGIEPPAYMPGQVLDGLRIGTGSASGAPRDRQQDAR